MISDVGDVTMAKIVRILIDQKNLIEQFFND